MSWFVYIKANIKEIPDEILKEGTVIRNFGELMKSDTLEVGIGRFDTEEIANVLLERAQTFGLNGYVAETIQLPTFAFAVHPDGSRDY